MCPGETPKFSRMAASVTATQSWNMLPLNTRVQQLSILSEKPQTMVRKQARYEPCVIFSPLFAVWNCD